MSSNFCIEVTDNGLKVTEGECRKELESIVLETIKTFVSSFPVAIKGILDEKERLVTLIMTGDNQHIEVSYPNLNKDGYSFHSALFINYSEEKWMTQKIIITEKEFKAFSYEVPSSKLNFEMKVAFKTVKAISKKVQIEHLLSEMERLFTLPTTYDPDKIITTVCKCLQVNVREIDSLKIPDKLKIENGEIVEAFVLGDNFCVFLSKEDNSVKYVSRGFSVEEYPAIQKRSMSYVKYDTLDVAVLENLHEEATKQIVALLQTVAQFKNM